MRGLAALVVIAAVVLAAIFFADRPGHVEIVWRDWQIDTSVGVLLIAALVAGVIVWGVLSGAAALVRSPGNVVRWRRERWRRIGERAATRGLIAIAAEDAAEARRQARRARRFLPDAPLTLLLSAQSAQLNHDGNAAHHAYAAMLDRPELAAAGLRGLLRDAVQTGDNETALRLAERARLLQPRSARLGDTVLALETRVGRWQEAAATLAGLARRGALSDEQARHRRGIILHELSREAETKGDMRRAVKLAARAQALAPDLAAPACRHAQLLLGLGRQKAAAKIVERAWRRVTHPELARVYGEIYAEETPLARVRCFERLASYNPGATESHLAVAEAALTARLWGEARRRLMLAVAAAPPPGLSRRLCLLMARLEEGEHGDAGAAREWFDRVVSAPPDTSYFCGSCGAESIDWHSLCPKCGSFDTLAWQSGALSVGGERGGRRALGPPGSVEAAQ